MENLHVRMHQSGENACEDAHGENACEDACRENACEDAYGERRIWHLSSAVRAGGGVPGIVGLAVTDSDLRG